MEFNDIAAYYDRYQDRVAPPFGRTGVSRPFTEVIVGAGPHAAIYAANRRGPRPLVCGPIAGGIFAYPGAPTWTLNSRNKPGDPDTPGGRGALNALPGCKVQAEHLAGGQYQTNDPLAWAVKFDLAAEARSYRGKVLEIRRGVVVTDRDLSFPTKRVIIATGLGEQRGDFGMPFLDFMRKYASEQFPLRNMRRVAVIGAGDSANTVVEALLGEGPKDTGPLCVGYVERIDWFGQSVVTREQWCETKRPRYHRIGLAFKSSQDERAARIQPYFAKAALVEGKMVLDNKGKWRGPYDAVVNCTGFENNAESLLPEGMATSMFRDPVTREPLGRKVEGEEIYMVGPCAELPFTANEYERCNVVLDADGENKVALWRYGPKTARLAQLLA